MSASQVISVLLVDDQAIIGQAVQRLVADAEDIQLTICQDPTKAIETATACQPMVILQDLVMPEVDGLTLVRFYRNHPVTAETPIVVLSSKEEAETKAQAFEQGANDYLVKLPDQAELLARIRYHARAFIAARDLRSTIKRLSETQSQLMRAEQMASVGQLAAGVAHEINNPIGFVYGNLSTLDRYTKQLFQLIGVYHELEAQAGAAEAGDKIQATKKEIDWEYLQEDMDELLGETREGVARVRRIVEDMKAYSQVDQAEWQQADVHQGIEATIKLNEQWFKEPIELVKEYGELPAVECMPSQLNQVLMNLLRNAYQAIDGAGRITIRTGHEGRPPQATADGDWVYIEVEDTGKGIPAENLKKIFDPFFTTLPVGSGTGLGLYSAHGTVHHHQGEFEVRSEPGQGSVFRVWLPVRQAQAPVEA